MPSDAVDVFFIYAKRISNRSIETATQRFTSMLKTCKQLASVALDVLRHCTLD
jgi:hypothetical protein